MSKSKNPTIKVSDILSRRFCNFGWREMIDHFGNLQEDDEIDVVKLLEWGKHIDWFIDEKLINLLHQDLVISYAHPQEITYFAQYVRGADIARLEDAVIASKNPHEIQWFAQYVDGASITKLEDGIIACGNPHEIRHFAEYVRGANFEKLEDAFIALADIEHIRWFAKYVKGANKTKLNRAIQALTT